MLRLLSLETATDQGAFALWSGEVTAAEIRVQSFKQFCCPAGQPHAETLLPALRIALNELDWSLASIDAIVFDAGPGMFTGLRVSAALAQGLAVALNKPVIPVCSLEVLAEAAHQAMGATTVLSLLDARMNQIYAAGWTKEGLDWQAAFEPCLVGPDNLDYLPAMSKPLAAAGTGIKEYPAAADWLVQQGIVDSAVRYPSADALARLGAVRFHAGGGTDPAEAIPVYIRDRVALTTAERAAGEIL